MEQDLKQADFIANIEKSDWKPAQKVEWFGFNIDLSLGKFDFLFLLKNLRGWS